MLTSFLYHRTSAAHGGEEGVLERLRQAVAARGWSIEAEHIDHQKRPRDARPAFVELAAALERRQHPAALVTLGLERLFPSRLPAALSRVTAWLSRGIHLVTLEEPIDSALSASWPRILQPFATLTTRQRSEATAAGHALRARAGLVERNAWNDVEIRRRYRAGESQRIMARGLRVAQSSLCTRLRELRAEGYLGEKDERARQAALEVNPLCRGGRPRKADPAAT